MSGPADSGGRFYRGEDPRTCWTKLGGGQPPLPSSETDLKKFLRVDGFGDWFVLPDFLNILSITDQASLPETAFCVAEMRDAKATLEISDDMMTATLVVTPAHGGAPLSEADVRSMPRSAGITYGVDLKAIREAIADKSGGRFAVANGLPPNDGNDADLKIVIDTEKGPKIDSRGKADLREIGFVLSVKPNDLLMVKTPARPGKIGTDITGCAVAAKDGKDKSFNLELPGVKIAPNDPNKLLAANAGRPIRTQDGHIFVENTVELKEVSAQTGNVHFDGTVTVRGDVKQGSKITATGSVIIGGSVEASSIEAGGDLVVKGGIRGKGREDKITAKGNVTAQFIENVLIECAGVTIDNNAMYCEIDSRGSVQIGKNGKGRILNCNIRAAASITGKVLGGPGAKSSFELTDVPPPVSPEAVKERETEYLNWSTKMDEYIHVVRKVRDSRPDLTEKVNRARVELLTRIEDAMRRLAEADRASEVDPSVFFIECQEQTVAGTEIVIGGTKFVAQRDYGPGRFYLQNGEICFAPLGAAPGST